MAKARSGLGRGLESLLGGGMENAFAQEQANEEQKEHTASNVAEGQTDVVTSDDDETANESKAVEIKESDIYVNKEDNVTIKSVVERPAKVAPKAPTNPPAAPKPAVEERIDFEVDIEKVMPNPDQPRTNFKREELEELSESIKKNGLLQPILVRPVGDHYQIIAGERRYQACKSIGMKKVPVRVKEAGDDEAIILALIENVQRSDLNPIEEAYGYRRMMERGKMTQSEVAQAVSKGRTTITNALRLLELPEDAQQLLFEEKITAGHARAILSIPSKEGRRKLTDKLVEEKLSVRDAERIAKMLSGKTDKPSVKKPKPPKSYKTVARALSDTLGTEVKIKSAQGKNKIEVSFKDEADLERLFRMIAKSQ